MAKHHDHEQDEIHDHDRGLSHDLRTLARQTSRREWLAWLGGASVVALVASCTSDDSDELGIGPDAAPGTDDSSSGGTCSRIPEETEGPYPGDGTNGANALALAGIVRSDIRSSIAGATGVAGGVLLTIKLQVVDANSGCTPLAGYAVYAWHCDREGRYSMYTQGVTGENYLRGVQVTDENGEVTFTSVFPGCYAGRWPHVHFEVFPSVSASAAGKIATSQLAFPEDVCDTVYATTGYQASVTNLSRISLTSDGIFRDSVDQQMAEMSGNTTDGYVATLSVPVLA
jgi:protocatechuate 3,4-dioxygenase beta subunit